MKTRAIILSFFILTTVIQSFAQSDSTINKEVQVIKAFKPTLSHSFKISSNPIIEDTVNYSPTFDYNIYSNEIKVEKNINHLPMVKLGNPPLGKSNTGYANLSLGNAYTPKAEIFLNTSPSKKTDFGFQLFHFSTNPSIKLNNGTKVKAPSNHELAKIFAKNYFRKSVLDWNILYERDRINYYGFHSTDTVLYQHAENTLANLNQKNVANDAAINFSLKNTNPRQRIDYKLNLSYNYFWNTTNQQEHAISYTGNFQKNRRKNSIFVKTNFDFRNASNIISTIDTTKTNQSFYIIQITPGIILKKESHKLIAGLNLATGINIDSTLQWNISPEVNYTYTPIKNILSLFVGASGGYSEIGYSSYQKHNPYISNALLLKPTKEIVNLYGGFKGKFGSKITYLFDISYRIKKFEKLPYLVEDYSSGDTILSNKFDILYADVNTLSLGGNIRYSSYRSKIGISGKYFDHQSDFVNLPYLPEYKVKIDALFDLSDQISIGADASIIGNRMALVKTIQVNNVFNDNYTDLENIIDINLNANYNYSTQLKFNVNMLNILNKNQQIFHGYNQQGLLVLLGCSYIF